MTPSFTDARLARDFIRSMRLTAIIVKTIDGYAVLWRKP